MGQRWRRNTLAVPALAGLAILCATLAIGAQAGVPAAVLWPAVSSDGVHAGDAVRLALRVELPPGVHVQSDRPRDAMLVSTAITVTPPGGVTVSEVVYPAPTDFAQAGQPLPLAVFEQQFVVGVMVTVDRSVTTGALVVPARLRYQACDAATCYAPVGRDVRWTLRVVPAGAPVVAQFPDLFERIHFRK